MSICEELHMSMCFSQWKPSNSHGRKHRGVLNQVQPWDRNSPGWAPAAGEGCPFSQPCVGTQDGSGRTSSQLLKPPWCLSFHRCPSDCGSPHRCTLGAKQPRQKLNHFTRNTKLRNTRSGRARKRGSTGSRVFLLFINNKDGAPLRRGSSLFSKTSRASVPSSIRSSLVITPIVLRP